MNSSIHPGTIKIFRVRKTVFKMLLKRGYAVSNDDLNMPLEKFVSDVSNILTLLQLVLRC